MTEDKQKISISLGYIKNIPLLIERSDEETYRKAEKLVNQLWASWLNRFGEKVTPEEVMARIAFQFARLYVAASARNEEVNELLKEFEHNLDDIVVKITTDKEQ